MFKTEFLSEVEQNSSRFMISLTENGILISHFYIQLKYLLIISFPFPSEIFLWIRVLSLVNTMIVTDDHIEISPAHTEKFGVHLCLYPHVNKHHKCKVYTICGVTASVCITVAHFSLPGEQRLFGARSSCTCRHSDKYTAKYTHGHREEHARSGMRDNTHTGTTPATGT